MSDRHDPAVITAVLAGVEVALNKTLALDVSATRELAEMAGTVIAIECLAPAIDIFLRRQHCEYRFGIKMIWKRKLHENSVNIRVGNEFGNSLLDLLLSR